MTVGRVVPVLNIIKDRSTNMYRVLITDDEKIEREGIKFLLAQEEGEYEIHEAANGRQALNVLRSEEIDFLLTDIKMPHMDGLELASKVREEYPNLPTVKETIGVGVNEKAALSSDKNCPFVYINFDFTLVNKVASL